MPAHAHPLRRHLSQHPAKMDVMPLEAPDAALLNDLDDEQREAVQAPRGPVCVLAGAGTGKTRTITRRIAYLVSAGHVAPGQVLAVTFTSRAAGEMRARLRSLDTESGTGAGGVQAVTFHAAARRQLQYFWPRLVGDTGWELLDSKFGVVAQAANRAGMQTSTDDVRDLAGEIEWAKSSLISPETYPAAVAEVGRDIP
ncbi:MAG: ATP-dependent helicase UvrD/PcrA, partial [Mycobacterium sp.]|nr:ATP-dependent helicase UvrD/PcrA [Mycobacterium sp.]